jgi:hypothetical protein
MPHKPRVATTAGGSGSASKKGPPTFFKKLQKLSTYPKSALTKKEEVYCKR